MPKKLVVVDNSDYVNRWQAFSWFSDSNVITVSIGSRSQFITAMIRLLGQGAVFPGAPDAFIGYVDQA